LKKYHTANYFIIQFLRHHHRLIHAFILQGKGLFSNRAFKEGDVILEEKPVICCQFLWNSQFGYLACDNCLKPLETAEENVRRLTGNPNFVVPHKECCEVNKSLITECHQCGVKYCSVECQNEAFQRWLWVELL